MADASKPERHELSREVTGSGNMEAMTPVCSCGWRGRPEHASNDTQLVDVTKQEQRHLRERRFAGVLCAADLVWMPPSVTGHTRQGEAPSAASYCCRGADTCSQACDWGQGWIAAIAQERERCAKLCEEEANRLADQQNADVWCGNADTGAKVCAALIRKGTAGVAASDT